MNTVEAKVIILTCYVKPNVTMAINKFQRSRPPHPYRVKPIKYLILWNKRPMALVCSLWMWSLLGLHKIRIKLDLLYGKVKFDS